MGGWEGGWVDLTPSSIHLAYSSAFEPPRSPLSFQLIKPPTHPPTYPSIFREREGRRGVFVYREIILLLGENESVDDVDGEEEGEEGEEEETWVGGWVVELSTVYS